MANEDLDQRARNVNQVTRGKRLRDRGTKAKDRGVQRDRGKGLGRRESGDRVQEIFGNVYIQF
jgi:hypothetical protein